MDFEKDTNIIKHWWLKIIATGIVGLLLILFIDFYLYRNVSYVTNGFTIVKGTTFNNNVSIVMVDNDIKVTNINFMDPHYLKLNFTDEEIWYIIPTDNSSNFYCRYLDYGKEDWIYLPCYKLSELNKLKVNNIK